MTTDVHPSDILIPRVLWAQRHDKLYVTLEVFEPKDTKVAVSKDKLTFSGIRSEDNARMAVDLDLFAEIDPEASRHQVTARNVSFILKKADDTQPFWPRLVKTSNKLHYIHTDFSKWVDEDDEVEEPKGFDDHGFSSFDASQFSGMDEDPYADEDNVPEMDSSDEDNDKQVEK